MWLVGRVPGHLGAEPGGNTEWFTVPTFVRSDGQQVERSRCRDEVIEADLAAVPDDNPGALVADLGGAYVQERLSVNPGDLEALLRAVLTVVDRHNDHLAPARLKLEEMDAVWMGREETIRGP